MQFDHMQRFVFSAVKVETFLTVWVQRVIGIFVRHSAAALWGTLQLLLVTHHWDLAIAGTDGNYLHSLLLFSFGRKKPNENKKFWEILTNINEKRKTLKAFFQNVFHKNELVYVCTLHRFRENMLIWNKVYNN